MEQIIYCKERWNLWTCQRNTAWRVIAAGSSFNSLEHGAELKNHQELAAISPSGAEILNSRVVSTQVQRVEAGKRSLCSSPRALCWWRRGKIQRAPKSFTMNCSVGSILIAKFYLLWPSLVVKGPVRLYDVVWHEVFKLGFT